MNRVHCGGVWSVNTFHVALLSETVGCKVSQRKRCEKCNKICKYCVFVIQQATIKIHEELTGVCVWGGGVVIFSLGLFGGWRSIFKASNVLLK